jgi:threonine dehydrogenase-like Zn-dependent dehydrogenase
MLALWLENQSLSLRDLPRPARPGEALIRVRLSGICGTDLELLRGYYPFTGVIGHEFVGEVIEVQRFDALPSPHESMRPQLRSLETSHSGESWIGQRVVGEINVPCGECLQCREGRPTHCDRRTVLGIRDRHGTHAEYTTLPLANLHRVPDSVPDEAAVFVEPLAAALEIQQQVPIRPTDRVLLVGAGRLGQLVAQTLALTGCDLRVLARHPHQKALLESRKIRPIAEDELRPRAWDVVVEASGSPAGFELARRAVRPGGTLVMKSTYKGEMSVNWSSLVVDEVTVIGSRCGPFAPALRLLERGEVDPTILIAGRYPMGKAPEAMEEASKQGQMKILISPV